MALSYPAVGNSTCWQEVTVIYIHTSLSHVLIAFPAISSTQLLSQSHGRLIWPICLQWWLS